MTGELVREDIGRKTPRVGWSTSCNTQSESQGQPLDHVLGSSEQTGGRRPGLGKSGAREHQTSTYLVGRRMRSALPELSGAWPVPPTSGPERKERGKKMSMSLRADRGRSGKISNHRCIGKIDSGGGTVGHIFFYPVVKCYRQF